MAEGVCILIVSDSVVLRRLLAETAASTAGVEDAFTAANGKIALSRMAKRPVDLVVYDMETESEDPLAALAEIIEAYPDAGLAPMCAPGSKRAPLAVRALQMGAFDLVAHPNTKDDLEGLADFRRDLTPMIRVLSGRINARRARRYSEAAKNGQPAALETPPPPQPRPAVLRGPPPRIDVIALGVSTGGPNALNRFLPRLPEDLAAPLLLIQHMPAHFTEALARNLARVSPLPVSHAAHGEEVLPGRVYLAPGDRHMTVVKVHGGGKAVIQLNTDPPVNSCRPSVDVLLNSLIKAYDQRVLAVIMTGMGSDGLEGVRSLKARGGYCLTQSEADCAVYGMPRSIVEAGLSDEQVPLDRLAERIKNLTQNGGR